MREGIDDSYGRRIYQITQWYSNNESLLYIGLVKGKKEILMRDKMNIGIG